MVHLDPKRIDLFLLGTLTECCAANGSKNFRVLQEMTSLTMSRRFLSTATLYTNLKRRHKHSWWAVALHPSKVYSGGG